MFAGIYYGAQYGGSTAAILLNTPGEAGAMMTTLDGNAMARRGRGAQALATAAIGSFIAGTIGTIGLTFVARPMVESRLAARPAGIFRAHGAGAYQRLRVVRQLVTRGLLSLFLGLLLGSVGLEPLSGVPRFAFGVMELFDGVDTVIVAVALFAVGETMQTAARFRFVTEDIYALKGSLWMSGSDWARSWKPWLRGTGIGFAIGTLPAGGSEVPTVLSYVTEKKLSKYPEEFGKGAIEGVAGPEAANNASAAAALGPLLALGLPTSATAAMMLAAFQQYGIRPGPLLFQTKPDLVWGLIASLYIGNALLLDPQPSPHRDVGSPSDISATMAVRRHSVFLDSWRLCPQQQRHRPGHSSCCRPRRLRHAVAQRARSCRVCSASFSDRCSNINCAAR